MSMFKSLLQPPGLQIVLLVIALLCWFRFRHFSFLLIVFATLSLYLFSTGFVSSALMRALEAKVKPLTEPFSAQAIVILGTGVLGNTPEYDNVPQPSALLTQRLRYGAKLASDNGLPILVSGGHRYGINEARVMTHFLEQQGLHVRWREDASLSTQENARHSAQMLKSQGITKILLVSHAWHLPRAVRSFERAGFDVVPAPTAFFGQHRSAVDPDAWLPDVRELRKSQLALYEYAGMLWYRLTGKS